MPRASSHAHRCDEVSAAAGNSGDGTAVVAVCVGAGDEAVDGNDCGAALGVALALACGGADGEADGLGRGAGMAPVGRPVAGAALADGAGLTGPAAGVGVGAGSAGVATGAGAGGRAGVPRTTGLSGSTGPWARGVDEAAGCRRKSLVDCARKADGTADDKAMTTMAKVIARLPNMLTLFPLIRCQQIGDRCPIDSR